jgi:hypothetical protein
VRLAIRLYARSISCSVGLSRLAEKQGYIGGRFSLRSIAPETRAQDGYLGLRGDFWRSPWLLFNFYGFRVAVAIHLTRPHDPHRHHRNRLRRHPRDDAAGLGSLRCSCSVGTHVDSCGLPGGAEGIRTDGHRERSEISSYSSLRQSIRAACSRLAPSIAIDALASVALLWLRSPASRRSPRDKGDRSRRGGDAANTGRIFS